jgi:hypothetical protein
MHVQMQEPLKLYMEKLWTSLQAQPPVVLTDIPVSRAQLHGRISDDAFDGGKTAAWLSGLGSRTTWRAVRDARTGHTIHCVSDRPWATLTGDLKKGLRLLNWMSPRPVVWYWWDHAWVRQMPAAVDPGRDHINGGWAIPGVLEVHVYRREEAHKVLLHETIHALGLDVPHTAIEPVRSQFEAALGRRLWPHLGEAFTELFAEWLWVIASARSLKEAERLWAAQLACSEEQAAIVWARIYDATADEDTNVFAYYILKWVLMQPAFLVAALIGPDHTVTHWFTWWQVSRPRLDSLAGSRASTEYQNIKMGMTCGI